MTMHLPTQHSFCITWRHSKKCHNSTERTLSKSLPAMLTDVAEMLEHV
jgi:hypothetical protein